MELIESFTCDLEGSVVNVEPAHHQGHILSAKDVGVILTLEDCFKKLPHFIGGPGEEVAKEIAALAGNGVDYMDVLKSKEAHYNDLLKTMAIEPRKGFIQIFNAFKDMGFKYAIGSLTNSEQAMVLLERSGIGKLFGYENIVLREDVENPKPAPDVWYETAKRAGVDPAAQLVFEDSPRGIQGAVKVGASCIGMPVYNRPDVIGDLVKAGAIRVFMEWDEINAQKLIENINRERENN